MVNGDLTSWTSAQSLKESFGIFAGVLKVRVLKSRLLKPAEGILPCKERCEERLEKWLSGSKAYCISMRI